MRLTDAQMKLLQDANARPQHVVSGCAPAKKLASLGLVDIHECSGWLSWRVEITPAGRARLLKERGE